MFSELTAKFSDQINNILILISAVNIFVHVIFAGAIAKDAGSFNKVGQKTALVSGSTWAFATLLGGVVTAAIYWFIHHSTITRPTITRETTNG